MRGRAILLFGFAGLLLASSACTVRGVKIAPWCEPTQRLAIVAQSVPSATRIPCVDHLPAGWSAGAVEVRSGSTVFFLNSDRAGDHALEVRLLDRCNVAGSRLVAVEGEVRRYDRTSKSIGDKIESQVVEQFPGGCVIRTLSLPATYAAALSTEADESITLYERNLLREQLEEHTGVDIGPARP